MNIRELLTIKVEMEEVIQIQMES